MWPGDVREHADKAVNCILVGNKRDLCKGGALSFYCVIFFFLQAVMHTDETKREVPTEDAERFAKEEGLLFVEASAKSGDNVEDAFARAASDILDKVRNGAFDDNKVCFQIFKHYSLYIRQYLSFGVLMIYYPIVPQCQPLPARWGFHGGGAEGTVLLLAFTSVAVLLFYSILYGHPPIGFWINNTISIPSILIFLADPGLSLGSYSRYPLTLILCWWRGVHSDCPTR
jgi:hypothetical protein